MSSPKILILGATGYIGGTYLHDLLKTTKASDITTLIRDEAMKEKVASLGVAVTVGSLDNLPLLTRLVSENDVVVNFAVPFGGGDSSIQAIVDALEDRAQTSEIKPVFIHTSGTGGIMYGEGGVSGGDVWKDSEHDRWEELPATAYFQSGNRIVAKAAEKGIISAYIISSPTVYGKGLGQVNLLSLQIPAYVRYAKRTGQAAYIGKGENIWGNVHVEDLSALYNIVLQHSLQHPQETIAQPGSHGWSNLIYAGVGQHTWKPVAELLGDLLHARGEIPNKGAVSIGEGEGETYMFGGNSWMEVNEKAKALGWKPTQPDLLAAIRIALPPKA